jgi:TetR/AcrR family transcriptional regulator, regulator of cefoperazone and chloramphenicol sensitivity
MHIDRALAAKEGAAESASGRASRQDGLATRQQILEVAGQVFARHGYANATSKEICAKARTNAAAVNYHFGGKDGLYSAVLVEAHRRLVTVEELSQLVESARDARSKLEAILGRLISEISRSSRKPSWEFRVLARELLSPSPMLDAMARGEAAPKARILRTIVAEIMRLPESDPAVVRSLVNVIAPCILLIIGHRGLLKKVLPDMDLDPENLRRHLMTYAMAGLEAVAKEARASSKA